MKYQQVISTPAVATVQPVNHTSPPQLRVLKLALDVHLLQHVVAMQYDGNKHALALVRVPIEAEERARTESRLRQSLKRDFKRITQRGRGLALQYGYRLKGCWYGVRLWPQLEIPHASTSDCHPSASAAFINLIQHMAQPETDMSPDFPIRNQATSHPIINSPQRDMEKLRQLFFGEHPVNGEFVVRIRGQSDRQQFDQRLVNFVSDGFSEGGCECGQCILEMFGFW